MKTNIQKKHLLKSRIPLESISSIEVISYFATSLFGKNSEEDILWDITKNCIGQLGLDDCVIYLFDKNQTFLMQKAAYGPKNPVNLEIVQPIAIPKGKGIVGTVAATGKAELIDDTSKDPRYILDDSFRYSEIAVPIIYDGEVLGVIDSEHPEKAFYTDWHLRMLTVIANLCANKIVRIRSEKKLAAKECELDQFKAKIKEFKSQKEGFRLPVASTEGTHYFPIEEIIRLEADRNYTIFHLTSHRQFVSSKTLKEYEIMLQNHQFLRIHKSHLVNGQHVMGLTANKASVVLRDKSVAEISRRKREFLFEHLRVISQNQKIAA